MANLNIKTELQRLGELHFDIATQCNIFKEKKDLLDSKKNLKRIQTVWMLDSWSTIESVESKHEELLMNIQTHHNLDQSIISLYLKILGLQMNKIETLIKRLEVIHQKHQETYCPPEFTVQSYQEWTRTNPKIHALQSEIFDLLTKKIRFTRANHTEDSFLEKSQNFQLSIEKLRTKTYFFLERDPLVDTDFSVHISNTVCERSGTFESDKIKEFINSCWEIHEACSLSFDYASHYQQFVSAITQHLLTKFGYLRRSGSSKLDLTCDQLFGIIESHIIPSIYRCIHKRNVLDDTISIQCIKLRHLTQEEIGIKPYFIDPSTKPYHEAIHRLKYTAVVMLPTQKLRQIILAAQSVMKRMSDVCQKTDIVTGADEFMDVWVYVVVQANIRNLYSDIVYVRDFCNPNYMLSETGYYLSSLELAAQFIRTVDENKFKIATDREKFVTMATVERSKLESINGVKFLREETIEGYQVVASFKWIVESFSLLKYAFVKSSLPSSRIQVYLFEIPKRFIEKLLPSQDNMIEVSKNNFSLPITSNASENDLLVFKVADHFHVFHERYMKYCQLKCFGINHQKIQMNILSSDGLLEIVKSMEKNFFETFMKHSKETNIKSCEHVDKILDNVIEKLMDKKLYSKFINRNNLHHFAMAIQKFQQKYNDGLNDVRHLRCDGICDMQTYDAILNDCHNRKIDKS